ncbi:gas vesicle protein [Streptomyces sp. NPDC087908]|uniref:gas vesicle protein GvpO n=1 Tax=unclassified Streptomyces TaxID=2593676 RepID=UPI0011CE0B9F|nr:gas vesicle protein [Streptomyces sp. adm13(2018)]TXS21900.1 gas vesicle protein [Streptomyces sp. adm13(2018)]
MSPVDPDRPRRGTSRPAEERRPPTRRKAAPARSKSVDAGAAMAAAIEQLAKLLGRVPESVSSLKPVDTGWEAQVEVVELERIPDTTSVLASYRVSLDGKGTLISFERTRRYSRGMIDRPF